MRRFCDKGFAGCAFMQSSRINYTKREIKLHKDDVREIKIAVACFSKYQKIKHLFKDQ